jgi:hypothetical protein
MIGSVRTETFVCVCIDTFPVLPGKAGASEAI